MTIWLVGLAPALIRGVAQPGSALNQLTFRVRNLEVEGSNPSAPTKN